MPMHHARSLVIAAAAGLAASAMAQNGPRIEPEPGAATPPPTALPPLDAPQTPGPEAGPRIAPEIPTTATLLTGVVYDGASDTNGSAGELRTVRFPVEFRYSTPINRQTILGISHNQTHSFYDFQPFSEFPGSGDPIDYGLAANFGLSLIHIYDRQWTFIAAANVGFAGEIDAEFEDSIVGGGFLGARYRVNENLSVGANLVVQTRFEEDLIVFPVPSIDWQFADYWNLKVGTLNQLPGTVTGGFALTHDLTDAIDVGGFAGVAFREFRLADDNSSAPQGILEDAAVPVGTFVSYNYSPNVTISGSVQALVYREINLRNRGGNNIADVELQPTLAATFGVRIRL